MTEKGIRKSAKDRARPIVAQEQENQLKSPIEVVWVGGRVLPTYDVAARGPLSPAESAIYEALSTLGLELPPGAVGSVSVFEGVSPDAHRYREALKLLFRDKIARLASGLEQVGDWQDEGGTGARLHYAFFRLDAGPGIHATSVGVAERDRTRKGSLQRAETESLTELAKLLLGSLECLESQRNQSEPDSALGAIADTAYDVCLELSRRLADIRETTASPGANIQTAIEWPALLPEQFLEAERRFFARLRSTRHKLTGEQFSCELQSHLESDRLVKRTFGKDANLEWVQMLAKFLEDTGLRVACLKKGCRMPSIPRYLFAGKNKYTFRTEHYEGGKQFKHGGPTTIPRFRVVSTDPSD